MIESITDRATFRALSRQGRRGMVDQLGVRALVQADPTAVRPDDRVTPADVDASAVRVAYAIGRRVGSAVVRNRLRRRLRASVDELHRGADGPLAAGSYLFVAEPGLAHVSYAELGKRVRAVIAQVRPVGSERS